MGLTSIIAVVFGLMQSGKVPISPANQAKFGLNLSKTEGYGELYYSVGSIGILIACLGCLTSRTKNIWFGLPYGILTFAITIGFIVIAIMSSILKSETG